MLMSSALAGQIKYKTRPVIRILTYSREYYHGLAGMAHDQALDYSATLESLALSDRAAASQLIRQQLGSGAQEVMSGAIAIQMSHTHLQNCSCMRTQCSKQHTVSVVSEPPSDSRYIIYK